MTHAEQSERIRLAVQVATHDARVRKAQSDPKLKEHLEDAERQLDEARRAFDNGPQELDPIEAEAQRRVEAEVQAIAVKARVEELRIEHPLIDTSDIEANAL